MYSCPYLPPMYYTITTFPYHVATAKLKTAIMIKIVKLHGPTTYVTKVFDNVILLCIHTNTERSKVNIARLNR